MSFKTIMKDCGYKVQNTFWEDFSIAETCGQSAIQYTYSLAFKLWKHDYKYLTELVLVLNHKIWQHYKKHPQLAMLYNIFWQQADKFAKDNLKDDELNYFLEVTN